MTRPLRYDDCFIGILNEKLHDKFLNIFNIKVQSTAFCQKFNLQQSLFFVSILDLSIGVLVFLYLLETYVTASLSTSYSFVFENILLSIGIIYGIIGIDSSVNLKKSSARAYKYWRIVITFLLPIIELINTFSKICYFSFDCNSWRYLLCTFFLLFVNIYFTKIAWSFSIRIEKNHELLIIHGKYLEKMMNEEQIKLNDLRKYIPPEITTKEVELINLVKNKFDLNENVFAQKRK